jgi:hypothetical protein
MSTWTISDAVTGRELGTIKHKFKLFGSRIVADGEFGQYIITGDFGNRSFTISTNNHEVNIFLIIK